MIAAMDRIKRKTARANIYLSVLMSLLLVSLRSMAQDCEEAYYLSSETIAAGQQVVYTSGGAIFCPEGKQFIVEKDGYATLTAGGRIELNAGFEVHAGGGLIALVEGCGAGDPGESPFSVFPNPTDGELHVESKNKINTIRLMDLNGLTLIEQKEINSTSFVLDLSKVDPGIYILEVIDDKTAEKVRVERK